jgi:hypothetical protein
MAPEQESVEAVEAPQVEAATAPVEPGAEPEADKPVVAAPEVRGNPYEPPLKPKAVPGSTQERVDALWDVIHELRAMAVDGKMPSRARWDAERPAGLPTSEAIMARFDYFDWNELAVRATLEPTRKGRPVKKGKGKR